MPFDFAPGFFNYRRYLDLVVQARKTGRHDAAGMIALILASLEHYVGWYTNDIERLERAVGLDPSFAHYRYTLAGHLVKRDPANMTRGCALLEELAAGSVVFPEALEHLGILARLGKYAPPDPSRFSVLVDLARSVKEREDQQLGLLRPALVTLPADPAEASMQLIDPLIAPATPAPPLSARGAALVGQAMFDVLDRARVLEARGVRVRHLELGAPSEPPPPSVLRATAASLERGEIGYESPAGLPSLRRALAERVARDTGRPIDVGQVVVSPANLLINQFLDLACDPGDRLVVFSPAFPTYLAASAHMGLDVVQIPLDPTTDFELGAAHVDAALATRPRAIIVNSANNPTGAVYDEAILHRLVDGCRRARHLAPRRRDLRRPGVGQAVREPCRAVVAGARGDVVALQGARHSGLPRPAGPWRRPRSPSGSRARRRRCCRACRASSRPAPRRGSASSTLYAGISRIRYARTVARAVAALESVPGLACVPPASAFYLFVDVRDRRRRRDLRASAAGRARDGGHAGRGVRRRLPGAHPARALRSIRGRRGRSRGGRRSRPAHSRGRADEPAARRPLRYAAEPARGVPAARQRAGGDEPPVWSSLLANAVRQRGYSASAFSTRRRWPRARRDGAAHRRRERAAHGVRDLRPAAVGVDAVHARRPARPRRWCGGRRAPSLVLGTHPSALPERTLREEPYTLRLRRGGARDDPRLSAAERSSRRRPGPLVARRRRRLRHNPPAPLTADLDAASPAGVGPARRDALPRPQLALLRAHPRRQPYASMHTSLGCPYQCTFCCINAPFGKPIATACGRPTQRDRGDRPPGRAATASRNIKFVDEMFVLNRKHVLGICDRLIERGHELNIWAYARVDTVKDEFLDKLKPRRLQLARPRHRVGQQARARRRREGPLRHDGHHRASSRRSRPPASTSSATTSSACPTTTTRACRRRSTWRSSSTASSRTSTRAMAYPGSPLYAMAASRNGWAARDPAAGGSATRSTATRRCRCRPSISRRRRCWSSATARSTRTSAAEYRTMLGRTFGAVRRARRGDDGASAAATAPRRDAGGLSPKPLTIAP